MPQTLLAGPFVDPVVGVDPRLMHLGLLVGFTLVALALSIRSPRSGFLLCIITLPLEATLVGEVGFTVRLSYLALFATALALLLKPHEMIFSRSPLDVFVVAYVLVAGLSIGMTVIYPPPDITLSPVVGYRGSIFRPLIQWLLLVLFLTGYFLAVHFCSNLRGFRMTLRTHVIVASIVAVYGIYQFFASYYHLPLLSITYATGSEPGAAFSSDLSVFRSHATFREPMEFGHYLLSVIPLGLVVCAHRWGISRTPSREVGPKIPINLPQVAVLLVALFFTGSRGAWFGLVVGVLAILVLTGKNAARVAILVTIVLAAIVGFLIPYLISGEILGAGLSRLSFDLLRGNVRWMHMTFALDFWINRPVIWLFGTGIGSFPLHSAAHFGSALVPNSLQTSAPNSLLFSFPMISGPYSLPLQILLETGLVGLTAFSILIVRAFMILLEALKRSRGTVWEALFAGYISSLTALFGHHIVFGDRVPLYVWILLGCSIGTVKAMMSARALGENMAAET